MSKGLFVLLALAAPSVFAATYKCVAPDGAVAFAATPCAPGAGESTFVPPASGNDPAAAARQRTAAAAPARVVLVRTVITHQEHITWTVRHTRAAPPPSLIP